MYHITQSIIGTAFVTATLGLKQESPTSYILFVIYINNLIKLVKENCPNDGFLKWLHILVLMVDTILLAASKDMMLKKVKLLQMYCQQYGMIINPDKTKFFVINVSHRDRQSLTVNDPTIEHCDKYCTPTWDQCSPTVYRYQPRILSRYMPGSG